MKTYVIYGEYIQKVHAYVVANDEEEAADKAATLDFDEWERDNKPLEIDQTEWELETDLGEDQC